jgi:hypothetical protein
MLNLQKMCMVGTWEVQIKVGFVGVRAWCFYNRIRDGLHVVIFLDFPTYFIDTSNCNSLFIDPFLYPCKHTGLLYGDILRIVVTTIFLIDPDVLCTCMFTSFLKFAQIICQGKGIRLEGIREDKPE